MSDPKGNREREDLALDALLASSFLQDLCDEDADDLQCLSSALSAEERTALEASSKERIARLLSGSAPKSKPVKARDSQLSTALNRTDEDGELTDTAKEEMERRIREAEEAKKKNNPEK